MALPADAVRVMLRVRPETEGQALIQCSPGSNTVVLLPPSKSGSAEGSVATPRATPVRGAVTPSRSARKA